MPQQSPRAHHEEPRFPELYDASDQVVNNVGSQSLPPREIVRRHPSRPSTKFGEVTRIVIDQALRDYALRLADGDAQRLVLRPDGSVIVANNHGQAKRALRDRTFGAMEPADTVTRLDDYAP